MPTRPMSYQVARLAPGNSALARKLFSTMAEVFEEEHDHLSDEYLAQLLARDQFWALTATLGEEIVGGLTAHTLPMTRSESREVFIYDIAVRVDHQRRGVGRLLVSHLMRIASDSGIQDLFVPADDEDAHAIEFYRALGGGRVSCHVLHVQSRARGNNSLSSWCVATRDGTAAIVLQRSPESASVRATVR